MVEQEVLVNVVPDVTERSRVHARSLLAITRAAVAERLEIDYAYDAKTARFRPVICISATVRGIPVRRPIAFLIEEDASHYLFLPSAEEMARPG